MAIKDHVLQILYKNANTEMVTTQLQTTRVICLLQDKEMHVSYDININYDLVIYDVWLSEAPNSRSHCSNLTIAASLLAPSINSSSDNFPSLFLSI